MPRRSDHRTPAPIDPVPATEDSWRRPRGLTGATGADAHLEAATPVDAQQRDDLVVRADHCPFDGTRHRWGISGTHARDLLGWGPPPSAHALTCVHDTAVVVLHERDRAVIAAGQQCSHRFVLSSLRPVCEGFHRTESHRGTIGSRRRKWRGEWRTWEEKEGERKDCETGLVENELGVTDRICGKTPCCCSHSAIRRRRVR